MKKTILFDKCHIRVYTCKYNASEIQQRKKHLIDKKHIPSFEFPDYYYMKGGNDNVHKVITYFPDRLKEVPVYEDTIHESPLGFYYATTECINQADVDSRNNADIYERTCTSEYVITLKDTDYHIIYFHSIGNNHVGAEKRPWELMDAGMEEHFITDLLNVLKNIRNTIDAVVKNNIVAYMPDDHYPVQFDRDIFQRDWQRLMIDIFGFADGPKFQTNNEKILAAGFDLKTSFRNM